MSKSVIESVLDQKKDWILKTYSFAQAKAKLEFSKKEAQKILPSKLNEVAQVMQLFPTAISIRVMKSRWGSCTSKGKVCLNAKLMAAPDWVSHCVIVHELAHLKVLNHSRNFWNLVDQYAPRHKEADLWLRENF